MLQLWSRGDASEPVGECNSMVIWDSVDLGSSTATGMRSEINKPS